VQRPDIWAAREVTLTNDQKLTPVLVGIWDSGVDVSLFPNQLYSDPKPTGSGAPMDWRSMIRATHRQAGSIR
jgi:hypothetical protein